LMNTICRLCGLFWRRISLSGAADQFRLGLFF
jgi:hypothetical protein